MELILFSKVTWFFQIPLSSLDFDDHARDKFLRLVGDRYDPKTGVITLITDRYWLEAQDINILFGGLLKWPIFLLSLQVSDAKAELRLRLLLNHRSLLRV